MKSTQKAKRARLVWQVAALGSIGAMSAQGCDGPFECADTFTCSHGGRIGIGMAGAPSSAGEGGAAGSPVTGTGGSAGGAGGVGASGEHSAAGGPAMGGAPPEAMGGATSVAGDAGAAALGGAATASGGARMTFGGTMSASGGAQTAGAGGDEQGGAGPIVKGPIPGGHCEFYSTALCSELYPNISECRGKRVNCPTDGHWPLTSEACVPGERDCKSTDDADCDGVRDNMVDAACPCTPGISSTCYLPGEGDCMRGISVCVGKGGDTGTNTLACVLPESGTPVPYSLNRVWCGNDQLLGAPCMTSVGPQTLVSQCEAKPNTCGYLYCKAQ